MTKKRGKEVVSKDAPANYGQQHNLEGGFDDYLVGPHWKRKMPKYNEDSERLLLFSADEPLPALDIHTGGTSSFL